MDQPDLHQSSVARALSDTARITRSPVYGFAVGSMTVLSGLTAFLTTSSSTEANIIVPIIAGIATVLVALLGTFIVRWIAAPYVQRNDLRRSWPIEPVRRPVDVGLTMKTHARQGLDIAKRFSSHSYRTSDIDQINEWTDGVVAFLTEYAPDSARKFMDCAATEVSPIKTLTYRASLLDQQANERLN